MPFDPLPTILLADLEQLSLREGSVGLDLGCGEGGFARGLRQEGIPVWGLDCMAGILGVFPDLVADAKVLPLFPQRADLLIAANLVRHLLSGDPTAGFLEHWWSVLRPGGAVFILEDQPDRDTPARRNYFELQKVLARMVGPRRGPLVSSDDFLALAHTRVPHARIRNGVCSNHLQPDPQPVLKILAGSGGGAQGAVGALVASIQRDGLDYGDYWWLRIYRER